MPLGAGTMVVYSAIGVRAISSPATGEALRLRVIRHHAATRIRRALMRLAAPRIT